MKFDTQPMPGTGVNVVVTSFTVPVGIDAQVAASAGFFRIVDPLQESLARPAEAHLRLSLPAEPRPQRFDLNAISLEWAMLKIQQVETGRFRLIEG